MYVSVRIEFKTNFEKSIPALSIIVTLTVNDKVEPSVVSLNSMINFGVTFNRLLIESLIATESDEIGFIKPSIRVEGAEKTL